MTERNDHEAYPQTNLSNHLLLHHHQLLQFLFFTQYDIVYQTFQLKHGSYSERNRGHIGQTFKSQQIARHYQSTSQKMHLRILRDDVNLDKQLGKLQILWHNRNVPYFHRYAFLKYLLTCYFKNIEPAIKKEEQLIRTEQHVYYPTFKSINARQACLRNLKKQLASLNAQDIYQYLHIAKERLLNERRKVEREKYRGQGYKLKMSEETYEGKISKTKFQLFSDCFNHLTKLTLYSIQLIVKWKEYIASITHDARKQKERMEYFFYDDNYFLKILTDLGFLKVSFLKQFYQFAPKNDPFLLYCILGFQKKQVKTVEHELLKQIFMPQKQHLADILSKMELLSEQYRYNIRSRKVFDVNVLKKPILKAQEKQINNEDNAQKSNLILKKIESPILSKKTKSLSAFRIKERQGSNSIKKKDKIIIQFHQSPLRKKLASIPGSIEKTILDTQKNSPLKNSIILQKNQNSVDMNGLDINLLNMLKKQIIKKVREQFDMHKGKRQYQNQALQLLIDNKVKETIKGIFPFQPQKHLKKQLQFTPLSVNQVDLPAQIDTMFKHSITQFRQMQIAQVDLIRLIEQTEFVYILVGKIGQQQIGRVICALQKDIKDFKVLKILYLHFPNISEIQLLIIKFVEFLWQFQNSFEVHYNFYQPANNQPIQQLVQGMEKTLQKQCIFGRKQLYSTITQIKLIFKRPSKNVNYLPNKDPLSFKLQFNLLFSHKKLMLQNRNQSKHLQLLNYDYFLMQALHRFLKSQDILTLKQRITWKSRLKVLVQMIKEEQQQHFTINNIDQIEAQNISELNNKLTKLHQPFLQVSDLVKGNHVSLLYFSLNLTPNYPIKSIYDNRHQQYFRFSIMSKFDLQIDQNGAQFYFLKTKQSKDYEILVFSAKQYLKINKERETSLNQFLVERTIRRLFGMKKIVRQINSLWIPMVRYPHKYKQRQQMFYHTTRVLDLTSLKYDVLLGEKMEWLCNMELQNSIKFAQHQDDIKLDLPFGVAVVAGPSRSIIYSRVVV